MRVLFLSTICSSGSPILLLRCLKMILFRSSDISNITNLLIMKKNKSYFFYDFLAFISLKNFNHEYYPYDINIFLIIYKDRE